MKLSCMYIQFHPAIISHIPVSSAVPSRPQPLRHLQLGVDRDGGGFRRVVVRRARATADSAVARGGDAAARSSRYDEQESNNFSFLISTWI